MRKTATQPTFWNRDRLLMTLLLATMMSGPACSNPTTSTASAAAANQAARANTAFGLDLFQRTSSPNGNLFFSPFSISSALAMTYAGARGETERQMAKTLHFVLPQKELHPAFKSLNGRIEEIGKTGKINLSVANSLWCQKGYPFEGAFLDLVRDAYRGEARLVDFLGQTEATRIEINDWVARKTQDKIKDLLQPGQVGGDTRLVLCNAIYFKGKWLASFDAKATRPQKFSIGPTQQIDAPTMFQSILLSSIQTDDATLFALPYVGEEVSMVVLLPKTVDGLQRLEQRLDTERLSGWLAQLDSARKQKVELYLPRFKLDYRVELSKTLREMGMPLAFGSQADFSGMTSRNDLYISEVVHQAFVEVNEEGTEAAAATAVGMRATSVMRTPVIRVDRPFLFLIREHRSGSVLFFGKIVDPTK